MKKAKKILTLVACAVLLVCISVGATLAYLQAETGVVTNTFTTGNVSFDLASALDEADVDKYGEYEYVQVPAVDEEGNPVLDEKGEPVMVNSEEKLPRTDNNQYMLIPDHTYIKDPTVHMSDNTEDAWLFVEVDNGIKAIEAEGATTIAAQMAELGWTLVEGETNVYAYKETVSAGDDIVVFNEFKLKNDLEEKDLTTYKDAQITIKAYAVQADGLDTAQIAWDATYGQE